MGTFAVKSYSLNRQQQASFASAAAQTAQQSLQAGSVSVAQGSLNISVIEAGQLTLVISGVAYDFGALPGNAVLPVNNVNAGEHQAVMRYSDGHVEQLTISVVRNQTVDVDFSYKIRPTPIPKVTVPPASPSTGAGGKDAWKNKWLYIGAIAGGGGYSWETSTYRINNNVMGAISAGKSRSFDLSKLDLPANRGSFIIRAAAFERYYNKARIAEENILYAGLVVYDLTDPKDKTNLNIFAGIQETEETYIYVSNTSKFVLELRLGTPNGDKLATLPPLMTNKKVYLTPAGDGIPYDFYPTYVYIDSSTNEIKSFKSRGMESRQRRIPAVSGVNPMTFNGPRDTSDIEYLVAFLRVKNDTNASFNFNDGTTWLVDQKGRRLVESSPSPAVFELPALSRDQGQLYTNLRMEFDNGSDMRLNQLSLIPGYVYDITVTEYNGNYAYDVRKTESRDKLEDMQISLFLGD